MTSVAARSVLVAACWVAMAPAQDAVPTKILVVGNDDGAPRPGVTVHVVAEADAHSRLDPSGQWLSNVGDRANALRHAASARTDPDGRAELPIPDVRRWERQYEVFVGAPFALVRQDEQDGLLVLRVEQCGPVVVRVVDSGGRPLPDFPVALHSGGAADLSIARTDARGVAILAVPPGWEARLSIAPAGWIGPYDDLPTVVPSRGPRQSTLVVPPSGTVRIRAVRDGEPVRVAVQHGSLYSPCGASATGGMFTPDVFGVEFGPVALGQRFAGFANFAGESVGFELYGPVAAGEVAVFDVDVTPEPLDAPSPVDAADEAVTQPGNGSHPRNESPWLMARLLDVPERARRQIEARLVPLSGDERPRYGQLQEFDDTLRVVFAGLEEGRFELRVSTSLGDGDLIDAFEIDVPAAGRCVDERLDGLRVSGAVNVAELRVVDQEGVPIAGAEIEGRTAQRAQRWYTDGTGRAWLAFGRVPAPELVVAAPGMRPRATTAVPGATTVAMERAGELRVCVVGVPPDVPRALLSVLVRGVPRCSSWSLAEAPVGDGDVAVAVLPLRGRYVVWLRAGIHDPENGAFSTAVAVSAAFELGDDAPEPIRFELEAEDLERLREALRGR